MPVLFNNIHVINSSKSKKNKEVQQVVAMCGPILDTTVVKIKIVMTDSAGKIVTFNMYCILTNSTV